MSVALNKVKGVTSVNVTLKRGVAHLTLEPGNSVSLPTLRGIIKDAGYAAQHARVTARGTITRRDGDFVLEVTGTSTSVLLAPDPTAGDAFVELLKIVRGGASVEIVGTIESPAAGAQEMDRLRVQSFTLNP